MLNVLLMARWVEFLAVPAKRFMRAATRDAFQHCFATVPVVVGFFGASRTLLRVLALVGLVADLLAVVALLWSWSVFKCARRAGFSSGMEEALCDESPYITPLGQVYHH
jgi:hypothetical protein